MELLIYIWIAGMFLFAFVLIFDVSVVSKLSDTNKLKKWWKRHIIDEAPQDMDI